MPFMPLDCDNRPEAAFLRAIRNNVMKYPTGAKYWISGSEFSGYLSIFVGAVGALSILSGIQCLEPIRYFLSL